MKNAQLANRISILALSLLMIGGCRIDGSDEEPVAGDAGSDEEPVIGNVGNGATDAAPSIWGEPQPGTLVGVWYSFQPEASDSDGDVLQFSVANKPDWAEFDSVTGSLQGIPGNEDIGLDDNIVISVTDSISVASLPSFGIAVTQVAIPVDDGGADAAVSSPPVIFGTPNRSAVVGSVYSFLPETHDEDGDDLSFSVVNKPSWASFDTTTGALEGRPTEADLGTTNTIELSASDGDSIAALAGFTITVEQAGPISFTVAWRPPTENEDGTPLSDLSGYRIYYGTTTGNYSEEVRLESPGLTSYVIENLVPGTYFLVMTSVNSRDMESKPTAELRFEVGS